MRIRRFDLLLALCVWLSVTVLAFAGCARKKSAFGKGLPSVAATPMESNLERQMFERLNRDRSKRGLPSLAYDDTLADIARYHSKDMRDNNFFGHDSPTSGSPQDRVDKAGLLVAESRENVAQAPDVDTAQDQLLQSPGHYANIVATTVTHVGIGVVQEKEVPGQVRGYFFTQLFASPVPPQSPEQARTIVLNKVAEARSKAGLPALSMHPILEQLAKQHVARLDPNTPDRSLGQIGDTIVKALSKEAVRDVRSVEAAAQVGLSAEMLEPERLVGRDVRAFGFAVATDEDAQGKPVVKMLFVVGR